MSRLVEYHVGETTVLFEVSDEDVPAEVLVGKEPHEVAQTASKSLDKALEGVGPTIKAVLDKLKDLAPDQLEIELGIKLTAEAGVIVSKVGGEANITVTGKWGS